MSGFAMKDRNMIGNERRGEESEGEKERRWTTSESLHLEIAPLVGRSVKLK